MGKTQMNIMRLVRIQLKSGYIKSEPLAYAFMKRYPPLTRDTAPPIRKLEIASIPYLRLYEDAVNKNPKYIDERVYPAYWQQEPSALTLAKKQYELMKQGLSEADAYEGGLRYLEELENKAYEELKKVIAKSGNGEALKPLENDAGFQKAMKTYRGLLSEVEYEDLDDKDKGEIDHVLQTKLLGWTEVERERRMKDPIFAIEFQNLLGALFPEPSKIAVIRSEDENTNCKEDFMLMFGVDAEKLHTQSPFYYDDYAYFFEKLREEPLLGRWNIRDRQNLSRWVTDTLALREIVESHASQVVQQYLDDLRAQFFPMVRYPDRAMSFTLPDIDEFKAILYANDVGYKRKEDKLFVQRLHKLPMLLFPKETFTTALLTDRKKLMDVMGNDLTMIKQVEIAGLDSSQIEELKKQLQQYSVGPGPRKEGSADLNMSALDRLVSQDDDDEYDDSEGSESSGSESESEGEKDGEDDDEDDEDEDFDILDWEEPQEYEELVANKAFYKLINGREKADMAPEEWQQVVRQYYRQPTTELERVRESFRPEELKSAMEAESEIELSSIKDEIEENDMIVRARLTLSYEEKEAARRSHVWEKRGILDSTLPMPTLRLE